MSKLNKISRKSTWVDMTAFVDVAFLILSFFMLATKFKPPEVVKIENPKSVSSENVKDKDVLKVSFDKDGRVFISFSNDKDGKENAQLKATNYPTCIIQALVNDRFLVTTRGLSNDATIASDGTLSAGSEVWLQSILTPTVPVLSATGGVD